ncbi:MULTISPECIES: hypothetical protein [Rhizobium]|uniref:hypothetical protein n=1 Tax=Rhizobium TaxID=379 RepID=UPI0016227D97|nr:MULTISPECIES: hypothetical protein [Rhizobium]MBB6305135.1 hypothetical protein [Rhizobium leucaenae]MDK4743205.1 hypothetical protein [Rhizobium sp. CNPSo 3464]
MSNDEEKKKPILLERPRAVFSQEDFELIRVAVAHYLHLVKNEPVAVKYSNLHHRLGRIS